MKILSQYPNFKMIQKLTQEKRNKVYLVGGFLRDLLVGKPKLDFDFAVQKDALKLARSFAKKIRGSFVLLDKERGCGRVCKKTDGKIATYDFADFRAKTFKADLGSRDFTINTLAISINDLKE